MRFSRFAAIVYILGTACFSRAADQPERAPPPDFARDVRPIISDKCFLCHGPDDARRQAQLRFDKRESAIARLESGKSAITPGRPAASELIARIESHDADLQMPPGKSGKSLSKQERKILTQWIEAGAKWDTPWGLKPPIRPQVPAVVPSTASVNAVDSFLLDRLKREGMGYSAPAAKETQLRRLSLDLIGLPPTVEEVDAFLTDASPDAYRRQVERMLKSPHHGEKWARTWLDGARYADSDGFEKDKPRQVWMYRDWVVDAFNADMPYDRFLIEQLAGDLLPNRTQANLVATGFLRNSMLNEEGGVDPEQFRMEAMFDRMDAVGKSLLGLTIQCAQCHAHKYDPISHEEYFGMFAFLNNADEGCMTTYTPAQEKHRVEIARWIAEIDSKLKAKVPNWRAEFAAWKAEVLNSPTWTVVRPKLDTSGGQKHHLLADGSVLASGYAPTKTTGEFEVETDLKSVTAVRLELLLDPNLPRGGPGRSIFGAFGLTEFKLTAAPKDRPNEAKEVAIEAAFADVNPPEKPLAAIFDDRSKRRRTTGPIRFAIDGDEDTAWGIEINPVQTNTPHQAVFRLKSPVVFPQGALLKFKVVQKHGGWNSDDNQTNNLGRFRFAVTSDIRAARDAAAASRDVIPPDIRALLADPRVDQGMGPSDRLFDYFRMTVPAFNLENAMISALRSEHPLGSTQLVATERLTPRATQLLERGDFLRPTKVIEPSTPASLHSFPAGPRNRLGFAHWVADRRSPTTARSFVNRVWQAYFGAGLVETAEDFGSQGASPTHPELLDWLAVEFMDSGWSVKHLHRLIVLSNAYRQSSSATPLGLEKDPYNRLLGRGPRFRLDGEAVRDAALSASGLLSSKMGGPSVYPPAPMFLFNPPTSYGPKIWNEARDEDRYRRGLYTFRFRSTPLPMLQSFDTPNGDFACVKRSRSNTPLQALTLLNEPLMLECARGLARTVLAKGGASDSERLIYAFRRCTSRRPTDREAKVLAGLLVEQKKRFSAPDSKAWDLAADPSNALLSWPPTVAAHEAAAWTSVGRVLLALDETIVKE